MAFGKTSIYAAFIIISLGYYLYTPMPDGAVEPLKYAVIRSAIRLASDISYLGEFLGFGSEVNITRKLVDIKQHLPEDGSLEVTDADFDGIPVRIYKPVHVEDKSPGLIYIHGGGWTIFGLDNYDAFVRRFAKQANITMVSVGYRLAPEHLYPVPLEDCLKAVSYFLVKAAKYGVDPERIFISGDSAGGNLAMAVALKLTTVTYHSLPSLRGQILIYPALQAFDFSLPTYQKLYHERGPFIISAQTMVKYWMYYGFGHQRYFNDFISNKHTSPELKKSVYGSRVNRSLIDSPSEPLETPTNQKTQSTKSKTSKEASSSSKSSNQNLDKDTSTNEITKLILDPYFAPLMASDEQLSKLPPTLIVNAEYDVLQDDGWILYHRLQKVRHYASLMYCEGLQHGFLVFPFFNFVSVPEKILGMSEWLNQVLLEVSME